MEYYYIVCKSLTYAQRAEAVLKEKGIPADILRSPKRISETGCGYSLRITRKWLTQSLVVLNEKGLSPIKVFIAQSNGSFQEVEI